MKEFLVLLSTKELTIAFLHTFLLVIVSFIFMKTY